MRLILIPLSILVFSCNSGKNLENNTVVANRDTSDKQVVIQQFKDSANTMPIEGIAYNQKGGAVVQTETATFWIENLPSWDSKFEGKKIAVWGDVMMRNDNPVFLDTGKIVSQGIPVHSEEEMRNQQNRMWITNARYELIKP
ncbi:MAG: hypothetical protein IPM77_10875 [Crocinitomicaceae bacterium]|nr:hypothetical protein [Crocinitomicaceae bacterium]